MTTGKGNDYFHQKNDENDSKSPSEHNEQLIELPDYIGNKDDSVSSDEDKGQAQEYQADSIEKKKWLSRTFSNLGPGSMRASIFNLSILSIGTGCLTLPQKFGYLSIVFCSLAVIIGGLATYYTLSILIESGRKKEISNYAELVKEVCGKRWGKILDCVIILNIAGIITLYQIISKL